MIRVFLFIDIFILLVATVDNVRQHRRPEDETKNNHRFFVNVLIALAARAREHTPRNTRLDGRTMFSSWNRHTCASTPSKIILIVGKEAHQGNREETKSVVGSGKMV